MNANTGRNAKMWNFTPTGTKAHAFVQTSRPGYKRAMCRANVEVLDSNYFFGPDVARSTCTRCLKLAEAMWGRAEASMEPADPYSDGFHMVDETTATVQGQPVETLADAQRLVVDEIRKANRLPDEAAVLEALDSPAVMDALHAEALAMDEVVDLDPLQNLRRFLDQD